MGRYTFSYSHGDTGTEPSSSLDFQSNERPDPQAFDWWWDTVISAIEGHSSEFDRLDSDDDGIVDSADKLHYESSGTFSVLRDSHNSQDAVQYTSGNPGTLSLENSDLNMSGSHSIQDAGTDAIWFDGSANVTIPNGGLDIPTGTFRADGDSIHFIGKTANTTDESLRVQSGGSRVELGLNTDTGGFGVIAFDNNEYIFPSGNLVVGNNITTSASASGSIEFYPSNNFNDLRTGGSTWRVYDDTNGAAIAEFNEGGSVDILGRDLQIDEGQAIQDDGSVNRFEVVSGATNMYGENASDFISINDSASVISLNGSGRVQVKNSNLRIDESQSIEDDGNNTRIDIQSDKTQIRPETGSSSIRFDIRGGSGEIVSLLKDTDRHRFYDTTNDHALLDIKGGNRGSVKLSNTNLNGNDGNAKAYAFGQYGVRYSGWDSGDEWRMTPRGGTTSNSRMSFEFWDDSSSDRTEYINLNKGGPIHLRNANVKINTDNWIVDGSGTTRIDIGSSGTWIGDDTGHRTFDAQDTKASIRVQDGKPFVMDDEMGAGQGVKYIAGSTTGIWQLKNADLDMQQNRIINGEFIDFDDRDGDGYHFRNGVLSADDEWFLQWRNGSGDNKIVASANTGGNYFSTPQGLRINEGNGIADEQGNERIGLSSTKTQLRSEEGTVHIQMKDSSYTRAFTRSGRPFQVRDADNSHFLLSVESGDPGEIKALNSNFRLPQGQSIRADVSGSDSALLQLTNSDEIQIGNSVETNIQLFSEVQINNSQAIKLQGGRFDTGDGDDSIGIDVGKDTNSGKSRVISLTDENDDTIEIYAEGGELKASDALGNITTLT